jgi:hypothetical protein
VAGSSNAVEDLWMATRRRKDVYRGVIAAVSDGDAAALDDLMARDELDHNALPNQAPGIEGRPCRSADVPAEQAEISRTEPVG